MKPVPLMLVMCAGLSAACTAFSCDDGLSPEEWDARELQRATARLPAARLALEQEFSRALRTQVPTGIVLDQLTSPVQETYMPGGIYTLGPRIRRHGLFSSSSRYLVYRQKIVVTPQDVVLMFSQSSTSGRPFTKVVPLLFEDIAELGTNNFEGASWLSMSSRQANIKYALGFARADSMRVARLIQLILQHAPEAGDPLRRGTR